MASLITGGTGLIGAELAHLLVENGEEVVLFCRTMRNRVDDIQGKVKWVEGDLGVAAQVFNAVRDNKITDIYHTGSMLSFVAEANPWGAFQTNVVGTYNVIEAARLFNVRRMMFTSSIATFGLEIGETVTDTTIQRPVAIYGVGKLYCEGLGRFYRNKLGLDFRCIRYAAVVGPSVKTAGHWVPPMIEDAVHGRPHQAQVTAETRTWMISLRDAARAAYGVLQAPKDKIKMVNYNVSGIAPAISAKEIADSVKKFIPGFKVAFRSEDAATAHKGHQGNFDDSYARKEWGWKPQHDTVDKIVEAFIKDMKAHPHRYGL
jgi:nucleoside-diphosphate-sugar epimerase